MIVPPQLAALLTFASFVGVITNEIWPNIAIKLHKDFENSNNIKYMKELLKDNS